MKNRNYPVIIIGMHRSGTSMITRMLNDCGLFVGKDLEYDHESLFFLRLNNWVLRQANATWDNPYNMKFIDRYFIDNSVRVIDKYISSSNRIKYMGVNKFLTTRKLSSIEGLWGWKDPRSTVTMDIWKKVYPSAKVIHIYRNPIDVACSLRKREVKTRVKPLKLTSIIKEKLLIGKSSYSSSVRVLDLSEGVSLWSDYTTKALSVSNDMDVLNIRYESFLEDPIRYLSSILDFIGIDVDQTLVARLTEKVNKERRFAFLCDETLIDVYRSIIPTHEKLLDECGYIKLT